MLSLWKKLFLKKSMLSQEINGNFQIFSDLQLKKSVVDGKKGQKELSVRKIRKFNNLNYLNCIKK